MFEVEWSGSYPCLCMGEWSIIKDNVDVSNFIPPDKRDTDMDTYGEYQSWHFEDWSEVFEDYYSGLHCNEWIEENDYWISKICDNYGEKVELYNAISCCDFRSGSCGGCI